MINGVETRPLGVSSTRLGAVWDGARDGDEEEARKPQIVGVTRTLEVSSTWLGAVFDGARDGKDEEVQLVPIFCCVRLKLDVVELSRGELRLRLR